MNSESRCTYVVNSSEESAVSAMSAGRSAMRMGPAELVQAAAMARRFYLEGKSKIQIAEEFGVSRFKVARVLETALERDLVRIEIRVPAELDAERSDALRARYGLRHAVVVESPAATEDIDDSPDPENLGEVAAGPLRVPRGREAHGARAGRRDSGDGSEPRAQRHDRAVLGGPGAGFFCFCVD